MQRLRQRAALVIGSCFHAFAKQRIAAELGGMGFGSPASAGEGNSISTAWTGNPQRRQNAKAVFLNRLLANSGCR